MMPLDGGARPEQSSSDTLSIRPEVANLFHALADLSAVEQQSFFQEHAVDPVIRAQVERLLSCDGGGDAELLSLVNGHVQSAIRSSTSESVEGLVSGPYRLIRLLGVGGMGEVWLADRTDGLLKRQIALKLPNVGAYAPHFAERMHREREILAKLEHPAIARLYDAGLLPDGRPFLALEYVNGFQLSDYCTQHQLPIGSRLNLFLQILAAVEHAHSRLVIHRDLKPANILVADGGQIKLLDFGIAKLLSAGEAMETELTVVGGRALTLSFASPEQICGLPVTTASDVYSLGMVLADLLCGEPLFQPRRATAGALEESILSEDPRRLSQTVDNPQRATERSTTVAKLRKALAGDLDSITAKAIARQPERRYQTVEAFRADVERYLRNEPVQAQPENVLYRLKKWLRRHRFAATAGVSALAALLIGLGLALWQASVARTEARTAQAVQEFTESIFRANSRNNSDPMKAQQTTARQLLDFGANAIGPGLSDAPDAKLKMLEILGSLYLDLGLEDRSVALEQQRLALAEKLFGSRDSRVVPVLIDLAASLHASRSEYRRESILRRAKEILDSRGDRKSVLRGRLLTQMTENYSSTDVQKAAVFGHAAVSILREGPPSADLATALYTAGQAFYRTQQYSEAKQSLDEAVRLSKRLNGDPNPDLPRYYAYLAESQAMLLQYSEAENSYRQAYECARKLGGDDDVDTLETESRLATFLMLTSRAREGLPMLAKAVADCIRVHGPDEPFYTPQMQVQYGMALDAVGRPQEALEQISRAIESRKKNRPWTVYTAQIYQNRAAIYLVLGRIREAEADMVQAENIRQRVKIEPDDAYLSLKVRLAIEAGCLDEAARLTERFYVHSALRNAQPISMLRAINLQAEISLENKEAERTIALTRDLRERLLAGHLEKYLATWMLRSEYLEGSALLLCGRPNDAVALLQKSVAGYSQVLDENSPVLGAAEARLGEAYLASGNLRSARALLSTASARLQHRNLSSRFLAPLESLRRGISRR